MQASRLIMIFIVNLLLLPIPPPSARFAHSAVKSVQSAKSVQPVVNPFSVPSVDSCSIRKLLDSLRVWYSSLRVTLRVRSKNPSVECRSLRVYGSSPPVRHPPVLCTAFENVTMQQCNHVTRPFASIRRQLHPIEPKFFLRRI